MFFRRDFPIYLKAWENIGLHQSPYAIIYPDDSDNSIVISWNTQGIVQKSYILELRGTTPYLRQSDGQFGLPYYNSGKVITKQTRHQIIRKFNQHWLGLIQIRLRIFDDNNNEYCTHDITSAGQFYEFEKEYVDDKWRYAPQNRKWGVMNNQYYFVLHKDKNNQLNFRETKKTLDLGNNSSTQVKLQFSKDLLFLDESNTITIDDWRYNQFVSFDGSERVKLSSDVMYYYRVWDNAKNTYGIQRALFRTSNTPPYITATIRQPKPQNNNSTGDSDWLTDEQIQRNHGEMIIQVTVHDSTSGYANLQIEYLDGKNYPCIISSPLWGLETNVKHKLLWLTLFDSKDEGTEFFHSIKRNADFTVNFTAVDDRGMYSPSFSITATLNNYIKPGGGTIIKSMDFNLSGQVIRRYEYPLYPVQAIEHFIQHPYTSGQIKVLTDTISKLAKIFSNSKLSIKQSNSQDDSSGDNSEGGKGWGDKFWQSNARYSAVGYTIKIPCPNCTKRYPMVRKKGNITVTSLDQRNTFNISFTQDSQGSLTMNYCEHCHRYYRLGDGITINGVTYCENCGTESILQTIYYPVNGHQNFKFHCNNCGKEFDKNMVFRPMHTDTRLSIVKQHHSMYHGYSCDDEKNDYLRHELELINSTDADSSSFIPLFSNSTSGGRYGIQFKGKVQNWKGLLEMNPRPQIEPYYWIHAPNTKYQNKYALYNDGATLKFDMEKDFLHDYSVLTEGYEESQVEKRLIDAGMSKTASNPMLSYMQQFSYQYTMPPKKDLAKDWISPIDIPQFKQYFVKNQSYNEYYTDYSCYLVNCIYTCISSPSKITVTQGVNDRYCYIVDGKTVQGSLFGTFDNIFTNEKNVPIVSSNNITTVQGKRQISFFIEYNLDSWRNIILALFTDIIKQHKTDNYDLPTNEWQANILNNDGNLIRDTQAGDWDGKYRYSMVQNIYNLPITQGQNLTVGDTGLYPHGMIKQFELVAIPGNCYSAIGVQAFKQHLSRRYVGQVTAYDTSGDTLKSPYITTENMPGDDKGQYGKHYFFNRDKLYTYPPSNSQSYIDEMEWDNSIFDTTINQGKKNIFVYSGKDGIEKFGYQIVKDSNSNALGYKITKTNNENIVLLKKCNNCGKYYSYNYQDCTNPKCKDFSRESILVGEKYYKPGCFIDVSNSLSQSLGAGKLCFAKWVLNVDDKEQDYLQTQIDYRTYTDSISQNAQPLFTCNKDQVNLNGYHFPYSEQQFNKTKKIYIRTFHGEFAFPYANTKQKIHPDSSQTMGYRNWVLQAIPGKRGRYRKKQVCYNRGLPVRTWHVKIDSNSNTEMGYFDPNSNCVSHEYDSEKGIYKPGDYAKWFPIVASKYCRVFDYVQVTQAWCKNYEDYFSGRPPFNRKCPVRIKCGLDPRPKPISVDYWGKYFLGPYAYSSDRQRLHYYKWFKSFPDQKDRFVYKKYYINGQQKNELPYPNQHFFDDGGNGESMVQRVYLENPGYFGYVPVITTSNSDVTTEYKEENSTVRIKRFKWHSNSESISINPNDLEKWFYSSNSGWYYLKQNGWYTLQSTSLNRYEHYDRYWSNSKYNWDISSSYSRSAYIQVTIDPFSPDFRSKLGFIMQHGYQPSKSLEQYYLQDKQGIYAKGTLIPLGSRYVYDLIKDNYTSYTIRQKIGTESSFVSDKSRLLYKDAYLPFIDFRLKNYFKMSRLSYFSGYPRKWHEAFATRPDIVYDYDNPIRITGFASQSPLRFTTPWAGFEYDYGEPSGTIWSWNGYNRIHWQGAFDSGGTFNFKVVQVGKESNSNSIKLKGCTQINGNYIMPVQEDNRWYIDEILSNSQNFGIVQQRQSAIIDNMEDLINSNSQSNQLKQNVQYKFKVTYSIGKENKVFYSEPFIISRDAISPATIVNASYDKWTGMVTIEFRFDDYYGRNYDVMGLRYETTTWSRSQEGKIVGWTSNWYDIDYSKLSGDLLNLSSNMYGDKVTQNFITTHKLQFDISNILSFGDNGLKFMIVSALAESRSKLELPVFTVKMWANEFLKPAEQQIKLLGGYKNNYVWIDDDYAPNEKMQPVLVPGHWEYVSNSKAPYVPGKIDDTRQLIKKAENDFQDYYNVNAKFVFPDVDAWRVYLKTHKSNLSLYQQGIYSNSSSTAFTLYDQFYFNYNPLFNGFLTEYDLQGYYEEYVNIQQWTTTLSAEFLNYRQHKGFIEFYNYSNLYDLYIDEHYLKYLTDYANSNSTILNDFNNWFNGVQVQDFNQFMFDTIDSNSESRQDYLERFPQTTSNDGHLIYNSNSLNYESYFLYRGRYNLVMKNYCMKYLFPDTCYFERKRLYNQKGYDYSTDTAFLTYLASEMPYIALFGTRSDYIAAYLTYKKENYVSNEGKQYARNTYMSFKEQGFTKGQYYQYLLKDLENYENQYAMAKQIKTICETDHRKNLIRQGYFCNGFLNNEPYKLQSNSGVMQTVVNTCFRFRTENQFYEGTYNSNYVEVSNSSSENQVLLNTTARFKVYYHVQMDFFDTFDSQNGQPLRDIWYAVDPKSTVKETTRIFAAQMDADNSIKSDIYSANEQSSTDVFKDKQMISTFSLPWKQMPGQIKGDTVPQCLWDSSDSKSATFNQIYYWRVASYNLLERPAFDTPELQLVKPITTQIDDVTGRYKHTAVLKINFASSEIIQCKYDAVSYWDDWRTNIRYYIYVAIGKKETPVWEKNYNYDNFKQINYYNKVSTINPIAAEWVNQNLLEQGVVQFLTDRPLYKSNSTALLIQDNLDNFVTSWIPYNPIRQKPSVVKVNGNYLMFTHKTVAVEKLGGQSYNQNLITMSRGFSSDIFGEQCVVFPRYAFQNINDVIQGALSFYNPYIRYVDGTYYLYFNVLFHEQEKFITRIYRALSKDLDTWYGFQCIAPDDAGTFPCIVKTPEGKYLMFVSKNSADEKAIYGYWNSNSQSLTEDNITFNDHEKLRIYDDFGYIGSISAIYQGGTVYRLYFSINGNIYYSDYDYSGLDGISNSTSSDKFWLNDVEMQKISKSFDSNKNHIISDISNSEPTIFLHDEDQEWGDGPSEEDGYDAPIDDQENTEQPLSGYWYLECIDQDSPWFPRRHYTSLTNQEEVIAKAREYYDMLGFEYGGWLDYYYNGDYYEVTSFQDFYGFDESVLNNGQSGSGQTGENGQNGGEIIDEPTNNDEPEPEPPAPPPQEDYSNYCFNPCIIQDDNYGTPILRLYYNTYGYPYVWKKKNKPSAGEIDKEYIQDFSTSVVVINTRYLDEYEWQKVNIMQGMQIFTNYSNSRPISNYWQYGDDYSNTFYPIRYADTDTIDDNDSSSYIMPLLQDTDYGEDVVNVNYPLDTTHKYIHLSWLDDTESVSAIKMLINPVNKKVYAYSQARWIDFNNINQTEALMRPEYPESGYNLADYTATVYVQQRQDLIIKFNDWIFGKEFPDDETAYMTFLRQIHEYSGYLKWSRRGQGIYYYNDNIQTFDWNGKDI